MAVGPSSNEKRYTTNAASNRKQVKDVTDRLFRKNNFSTIDRDRKPTEMLQPRFMSPTKASAKKTTFTATQQK